MNELCIVCLFEPYLCSSHTTAVHGANTVWMAAPGVDSNDRDTTLEAFSEMCLLQKECFFTLLRSRGPQETYPLSVLSRLNLLHCLDRTRDTVVNMGAMCVGMVGMQTYTAGPKPMAHMAGKHLHPFVCYCCFLYRDDDDKEDNFLQRLKAAGVSAKSGGSGTLASEVIPSVSIMQRRCRAHPEIKYRQDGC